MKNHATHFSIQPVNVVVGFEEEEKRKTFDLTSGLHRRRFPYQTTHSAIAQENSL